MKVAFFTYKQLKELLDKPSDDATRKWVDSRGLKRRNKENSNTKEVLVPFELYKKLWESAGRPPEFSNPPTEELSEDSAASFFEDESIINAEFSAENPYGGTEDSYKPTYALSTEFTEDFIKELAARQDSLMNKNDNLYNRISELVKYEERARILEEEISKKEDAISKYQEKLDNLNFQMREMDVLKVKIDLINEMASLKDSQIQELKEKVDKMNEFNRDLEEKLSQEKSRYKWIKKITGI